MSEISIAAGLKLDPTIVAGIVQSEVEQYAAVSGDRNPIHFDAALVKAAGLDGVPVQGMLIMALVSSYVENWGACHKIEKLDMRFVAPAIVNNDLTISARVVSVSTRHEVAILRISVLQGEKLVSMGEAKVLCS